MMKYLSYLLCFLVFTQLAYANGRSPPFFLSQVYRLMINQRVHLQKAKVSIFLNLKNSHNKSKTMTFSILIKSRLRQLKIRAVLARRLFYFSSSHSFAVWGFLMRQLPEAKTPQGRPQIYVVEGEDSQETDEEKIKKAS